jgi:hypothetical protein
LGSEGLSVFVSDRVKLRLGFHVLGVELHDGLLAGVGWTKQHNRSVGLRSYLGQIVEFVGLEVVYPNELGL